MSDTPSRQTATIVDPSHESMLVTAICYFGLVAIIAVLFNAVNI